MDKYNATFRAVETLYATVASMAALKPLPYEPSAVPFEVPHTAPRAAGPAPRAMHASDIAETETGAALVSADASAPISETTEIGTITHTTPRLLVAVEALLGLLLYKAFGGGRAAAWEQLLCTRYAHMTLRRVVHGRTGMSLSATEGAENAVARDTQRELDAASKDAIPGLFTYNDYAWQLLAMLFESATRITLRDAYSSLFAYKPPAWPMVPLAQPDGETVNSNAPVGTRGMAVLGRDAEALRDLVPILRHMSEDWDDFSELAEDDEHAWLGATHYGYGWLWAKARGETCAFIRVAYTGSDAVMPVEEEGGEIAPYAEGVAEASSASGPAAGGGAETGDGDIALAGADTEGEGEGGQPTSGTQSGIGVTTTTPAPGPQAGGRGRGRGAIVASPAAPVSQMRLARAPMGQAGWYDSQEDGFDRPDPPSWDPLTGHFRRLQRVQRAWMDKHRMWMKTYRNRRRTLQYVDVPKPMMHSLQLSSSVSNKVYYDYGGHPILRSTPLPADGSFPHLRKPSYMSPPCPANAADREAYPELCGGAEDRGMEGRKPLYAALLPVALVPALVPEESETAIALRPDRATGMWLKVHLKTMQITPLYEAWRET